MLRWRNWQTQGTQNPPPREACGFKSHSEYQALSLLTRKCMTKNTIIAATVCSLLVLSACKDSDPAPRVVFFDC